MYIYKSIYSLSYGNNMANCYVELARIREAWDMPIIFGQVGSIA